MKKKTEGQPPAGYKEIVGQQADTWKPKAKGEFIQGEVTETRLVKTTRGKKKIETPLMVLTDNDGTAAAVWISANLAQKLGDYKKLMGRSFMLVYMGAKKLKAGQNAMKVFKVFEKVVTGAVYGRPAKKK